MPLAYSVLYISGHPPSTTHRHKPPPRMGDWDGCMAAAKVPPCLFLLEDSMERQLITHTHTLSLSLSNLPPCDRANLSQADRRDLQPQNACQLSVFAARQGLVRRGVVGRKKKEGKKSLLGFPVRL
ncbi:hypothetical protein CGRA01v4_13485 [Colletotrichum graminicola]|nr:hypothetical protein CGRA01v4_13485 [Colletotrichum graminicola]